MKVNSLVVAIYFHPEAYPPLLNMLNLLGPCSNMIKVVHRPHLKSQWNYSPVVELVPGGKAMSAREQETAPLTQKVAIFLLYTRQLLKTCKQASPDWILLNDPLAVMAYYIIRPFLRKKPKTWYHSHDVTDIKQIRKYSLSWMALRAEKKLFRFLDLFTLPAQERLNYYPVKAFSGTTLVIPNYPSLLFYKKFIPETKKGETIQLIYQGRISEGHFFESIIPALNNKVNGQPIALTLVGQVTETYREQLLAIARQAGVEKQLAIMSAVPYEELPVITRSHHIGLAVHQPNEIIYQTGGTASNKIYEYAAVGLPVLLYDTPNYRQHLGGFSWAFFVDGSWPGFADAISAISKHYDTLSNQARSDWESGLNYESVFSPVLKVLTA